MTTRGVGTTGFVVLFICAFVSRSVVSQDAAANWRQLLPSGQSFPPRRAHCAVSLPARGAILVVGGLNRDDEIIRSSWEHLEMSSWWRPVDDSGETEPFANAACVAIGGTSVLVYGGIVPRTAGANQGHTITTDSLKMLTFTPGTENSAVWTKQTVTPTANSGASNAGLARSGHAALLFKGDLFVYGGRVPGVGRTSSTLRFTRDGDSPNSWTVTTLSLAKWPPPRSHSTGLLVQEHLFVIFGGIDASGAARNDAWTLALDAVTSGQEAGWTSLASNTESPPARAAASATMFGQRMLLHGGQANTRPLQFLSDSWLFDFSRNAWTKVQTGTSGPDRSHHALVSTEKGALCIGGAYSEIGTVSNSLHLLKLGSSFWIPVTAAGNIPSPRHGHIMVTSMSNFIVHGGIASGATLLAGTWMWSITQSKWSAITNDQGNGAVVSPDARAHHGAAVFHEQVMIFGGVTDHGLSNEVWWLHPSSPTPWRQEHKGASKSWPSPRSHMAMSISGHTLIIWGGRGTVDGSGGALNDLWTRSLASHDGTLAFVADGMLSFDGHNDFVTSPALSAKAVPTFTFEAWVLWRTMQLPNQGIFSKGDGPNADFSFTRCSLTNTVCLQVAQSSSFQIRGTTEINDGQWHHIATSSNLTHRMVMVDGHVDKINEADNSGATGLGTFQFGRSDGYSFLTSFDGYMDQVRYWSVFRSPQEIADNMFNTVPNDAHGLEGEWLFDGDIAQALRDSSQWSHDLKLDSHWDLVDPVRPKSTRPKSTAERSSFHLAQFGGDFVEHASVATVSDDVNSPLPAGMQVRGRVDAVCEPFHGDFVCWGGSTNDAMDTGVPLILDMKGNVPTWVIRAGWSRFYNGVMPQGSRSYLYGSNMVILGVQNVSASDAGAVLQQVTIALGSQAVTEQLVTGTAPPLRYHAVSRSNDGSGQSESVFSFGGEIAPNLDTNALFVSNEALEVSFGTRMPLGIGYPNTYMPKIVQTLDPDVLVYFGGWHFTGPGDELFLYHVASATWEPVLNYSGYFGMRATQGMDLYDGQLSQYQDKVILYGGETIQGFHNDFKMLNWKERAWQDIDVVGAGPPKLAYHKMLVVANTAYLLGGLLGYYEQHNDMWTFDFTSKTWTNAGATSVAGGPTGRWEFMLEHVPFRNELLVGFGQHGGDPTARFADLFAYDLATSSWKGLTFAKQPSPRRGPGTCIAGKRLVLFGGLSTPDRSFGGDLNDIWVMDLEQPQASWTWENILVEGGPSPRSLTALTPLVSGSILMTGGATHLPEYLYLEDNWQFLYDKAYPRLGVAEGSGKQVASAGQVARFEVKTRNVFGDAQTGQCTDAVTASFTGKTVSVRFLGDMRIGGDPQTPGCVYVIEYRPVVAGIYQSDISVSGVAIVGSPFEINVKPSSVAVSRSGAVGVSLSVGTVGVTATFLVSLKDNFGNSPNSGADVLAMLKYGEFDIDGRDSFWGRQASVLDKLDGSYECSFVVTRSGVYVLSVHVNGHPLPASPFKPDVKPETPYGAHSILSDVPTDINAGEAASIRVQTVDRYHNNVTTGADDVVGLSVFLPSSTTVIPKSDIQTTVTNNNDGSYFCYIFPFIDGVFDIEIRVAGVVVQAGQTAVRRVNRNEASTNDSGIMRVSVRPLFEQDDGEQERRVAVVISAFVVALLLGVALAVVPAVREIWEARARKSESVAVLDAQRQAQMKGSTKRRTSVLDTPEGRSGHGSGSGVQSGSHDDDGTSDMPPAKLGGASHVWEVKRAIDELNGWQDGGEKPTGYKVLIKFLLWFIIYLGVQVLQNDPSQSYVVNSSLQQLLTGYRDVTTQSQFFEFLTTMVDSIFREEWYNAEPYLPSERGYIRQYNKLIGGVLIVQHRMAPMECSPSDYNLFYGDCYHTGSSREPFGTESAFQYDEEHGGHVLFLSVSSVKKEIDAMIENARENLWIDKSTRSVSIKFATYNGEVSLFSDASLNFHFGLGGVFTELTTLHIQSARFELFTTSLDWVRVVLELFLVTMWGYEIAAEGLDFFETVKEGGYEAYFASFWNWLDVSALLFQALYLCTRLTLVVYLLRNPIALPSSSYITTVETASNVGARILFFNACTIFVSIGRLFKMFSFQPRMNIVAQTIARSVSDMFHFFVLFFCILVSFAFLTFLVFGPHMLHFSNISNSMQTLLEILLGEFDFSQLRDVDPFMASLVFWLFVIIGFYVMVNIFLAILIDSYADAKASSGDSTSITADLAMWIRLAFARKYHKSNALLDALQYFDKRHVMTVSESDIAWCLAQRRGESPKSVKKQLIFLRSLPHRDEKTGESIRITLDSLMRNAWDLYDEDGNGTLSHVEFEKFIHDAPIRVDPHDIESIMNMVDTNRDGVIQFQEFSVYFNDMMQRQMGRRQFASSHRPSHGLSPRRSVDSSHVHMEMATKAPFSPLAVPTSMASTTMPSVSPAGNNGTNGRTDATTELASCVRLGGVSVLPPSTPTTVNRPLLQDSMSADPSPTIPLVQRHHLHAVTKGSNSIQNGGVVPFTNSTGPIPQSIRTASAHPPLHNNANQVALSGQGSPSAQTRDRPAATSNHTENDDNTGIVGDVDVLEDNGIDPNWC